MGWYEDRRAGHPYFDTHQQVVEILARLMDNEDLPHQADLGQLWGVVATVRTRLDQVPAAFLPIPVLNSISDALVPIRDGLVELEASKTTEAALVVLNRLDEFDIRALPVLTTPVRPELVSDAIVQAAQSLDQERARLRQHADEEIGRVRDEANQSTEVLQTVRTEATSLADAVRTDIATASEQLASTVTQHTTDVQAASEAAKTQVTSQVQRLDAAITDHSARFSTDQEERKKQFTDSQEEQQLEAEAQQARLIEATAPQVAYLEERAEAARSIVAATAAGSTAGEYLNAETRERQSADRWRTLGMAVLVGAAIAGTILALATAPKPADGWEAIITYYVVKSPIAALFVYIGVYALRQSAGHRERATRYGRVARELSVFRPFIDELAPEPRQQEIREATKRYFPGQTMERSSPLDVPLPAPPPR